MLIGKKAKLNKVNALTFICLVFAVSLFCSIPVLAATRNTDVTTATTGNTLVSVKGTFYSNTKEQILNRINAIRKEACQEGVTNPSTGKALTMDDYVPIKWSSDLEWIAQTRAAEATVNESHTRPNGTSCFSIQHNGVSSWGEVLAWNYSGMMYGIEQWYGEKEDWVKNTGAVTGHYTSMIDPENLYIGLGCFRQNEGDWYAVAGEFSFENGLDEAKTGVTGAYSQRIEVPAASLSASLTSTVTMDAGGTKKLTFNVKTKLQSVMGGTKTSPCTLVNNNITWSSSNNAVASVDSTGTITAHKKGTATITAKVSNGLKATCKVKVNKKITVARAKTPKLTNLKGKKLKITYAATSGAKGYQIQYSTSKKFSSAKTKTLTKKSYTVTLKKGKKYYVRVRAYKLDSSKNKVYGAWSKVKSITIKK